MFQRRPRPLGAAFTILLSAAFLSLLFVPAKDTANLRFFLDWRPALAPLLLIAALAVLALSGRRLPAALRWVVAVLLFAMALWQLADALVLDIFDRELNLYFDLAHVPKLAALFYDAAGPVRGLAGLAALGLGSLALIAAIAYALARVERALAPPRRALACLVALALLLPAAALIPVGDGGPLVAARTLPVLGRQMAVLYRSFAVMHGLDTRYAAALAAPQPTPGALPSLKHRDVTIVFFESYGSVVLDDPRYRAEIEPALADFAATVERAGYHLRSSRIVSPTYGGGSWLAHGTIDSGLRLDPLLTRLILASDRETLPRYMKAAGYRTVEVMPGLKSPEPEHDFWGFDRSYAAAELGYGGPPFGWFDIPDQYTLRRFDETEAAPGHKPLFAQIVLVSSHTPFVPVPPYVEDWTAPDLYRGVSQTAWQRIYAPPDWSHLEAPYVESVVYDLKTLGAWLARREGDGLVVILGDHQPPGFISGAAQPWTVPIHVLSRDPDLVQPFAALGYVEGALPPREGAFKGMESFLGDFLAAFSPVPAVAADRAEMPERVPD